MYNADRRSKEFIDGLPYFLSVAEVNKQNGFMCCRVFIAKITRITHLQESYIATFSQMVSWRSIFVGRSTENMGLPWKTMKKIDVHFFGNAGFGAFYDDIPMEEPKYM